MSDRLKLFLAYAVATLLAIVATVLGVRSGMPRIEAATGGPLSVHIAPLPRTVDSNHRNAWIHEPIQGAYHDHGVCVVFAYVGKGATIDGHNEDQVDASTRHCAAPATSIVAVVTRVVHRIIASLTPVPTQPSTSTSTPAPSDTPVPTITATQRPTDTPSPTVVVTSTPAPTGTPVPTQRCNNGAGNGDNCTPGHSSGSNQGQGVPTGDQTNQGEQGNSHK
jgi:hypothetical protein